MRRDIRASLVAYRFDSLPDDWLDAIISTRVGGTSERPYASLNLGLRVADDDSRVVENRRRFFAAYELPLESSVWCSQVHADHVTVVTRHDVAEATDRGAFVEATSIGATDALVTDLVGVPICVTLADCVPVVLYDPDHHVVGLAHAGWGGTVARIASRTVRTMVERFGTDPARLRAAIGPSIAPDRYEVGHEVIAAAQRSYGARATEILRPSTDDKALFDLWEANVIDLDSAGVRRDQVELTAISTIDRLEEFYSHRAEGTTGRFIAAVNVRNRPS
jgi:YfiH family protein